MKELLDDLDRWRAAGKQVAVARVIDVEGSGPREPGAAMAVNEDGEVAGSVSGGCVEGAVVTDALGILETGERKVVSFGYSDDEAFEVGLTCGGTIHLFLEALTSRGAQAERDQEVIYEELRDALQQDDAFVLATVIEGPGSGAKLLVRPGHADLGSLGTSNLDRVVARDAQGALAAATSEIRHYGPQGEARERTVSVFLDSFAPPPRMLIFGAVDFTAALARAAKLLGYQVTVCDAREVFATKRRFPMADAVQVDWPQRLLEEMGPELNARDAVCVLTHDAKFDVPAIREALRTNAGYIGAMGSRRTHATRVERLRDEGVSDEDLSRVMAPIGLDIGARTPEETAISICAEIIAVRTGRRGAGSLRDTKGPIH